MPRHCHHLWLTEFPAPGSHLTQLLLCRLNSEREDPWPCLPALCLSSTEVHVELFMYLKGKWACNPWLTSQTPLLAGAGSWGAVTGRQGLCYLADVAASEVCISREPGLAQML